VKQISDKVCEEMAPGGDGHVRFSVGALAALQETTESSLVFMFEMSNQLAIHARRVTVMPRDVQLFREFVDALQPENYLSGKRELKQSLVEERRKQTATVLVSDRDQRRFKRTQELARRQRGSGTHRQPMHA
jgi:histone H3/H4